MDTEHVPATPEPAPGSDEWLRQKYGDKSVTSTQAAKILQTSSQTASRLFDGGDLAGRRLTQRRDFYLWSLCRMVLANGIVPLDELDAYLGRALSSEGVLWERKVAEGSRAESTAKVAELLGLTLRGQ